MLYFNTWGILNTFGAYQTYYESGALFHSSSSDISWVGSIAAFMLLFVGLFVGPIYDRGYLRTLLIVGSLMIAFGHMMLSLCSEFWQVVLAQGFVVGIGTGCLFVPCVAIIPQYFTTKMGAAMGAAASGSALGGVIYPIVLYRLINQIGFPWAVRVIGFIALGTLLIPISIMRLRVQPPKVRAMVDPTAFKDPAYLAFVFTSLIAYMGLFVILFYLSFFAEATRITDSSLAFYMVPIFNAASVFGRTIPNKLADHFGPFNLLVPAALSSGMLMFCMMAVHSKAAVYCHGDSVRLHEWCADRIAAYVSGHFNGGQVEARHPCWYGVRNHRTRRAGEWSQRWCNSQERWCIARLAQFVGVWWRSDLCVGTRLCGD
ncbi:hypothetical protein VN97_g6212 [Penicillium thymicola]|uniref:Major facilitator superfamily (MFS) profile domain-containing protein n=1 Tax=Penicillium thymicola TaxID=293382 RepID=A0AAI9TI32_PENTH|nr:hypothetical protein VN97_g6212 [Penicillium thymicola]